MPYAPHRRGVDTVQRKDSVKTMNDTRRDTVCIDTYRVLDSCRDKDCFEDVRVYLTEEGQDIVDRSGSLRVRDAQILRAYIDIDPMPFHRGFYQLHIRLFIKIVCEACVGQGNTRELCGVCAVDKKTVLFGSEGNVSIFKSSGGSGFCPDRGTGECSVGSNLPIAVLETVEPLVLNSRIAEPHRPCCCACSVDEIPDDIGCMLGCRLTAPENANRLLVSLGLFSVVRLERPAQYLISASDYAVPEKECGAVEDDNPCSAFRNMKFPISEFSPPSGSELVGDCGCGASDASTRRCGG